MKVYVHFELSSGLTVAQEIHGDLKETLMKASDETRLAWVSDFLNLNKDKFITHSDRVIQVKTIQSAFVEVRSLN